MNIIVTKFTIFNFKFSKYRFSTTYLNFKARHVRGSNVNYAVLISCKLYFWNTTHFPNNHIHVLDILIPSTLLNTISYTTPTISRYVFHFNAAIINSDVRKNVRMWVVVDFKSKRTNKDFKGLTYFIFKIRRGWKYLLSSVISQLNANLIENLFKVSFFHAMILPQRERYATLKQVELRYPPGVPFLGVPLGK